MDRSAFIAITLVVAGGPLAGRAQQKALPVIGYLDTGSPGALPSYVAAFLNGLGETGYTEGQNVAIEYRWAAGRLDQLPALAAELVARKVDEIVASGGFLCVLAAKNATSTIPLSSRASPTPWGAGWSPVSPGRTAISRASALLR